MEFRDLKKQYQYLQESIDEAIKNVLISGTFIGGKPVEKLEKELAEYVNVKHCITCANGTDALSLVLMAWNIKEGDAVFLPNFTFFATGEVVSLCGATPIFIDVEDSTFNIDPVKLEAAIIKVKEEGVLIPKAVIPVDLFGLPANYPEISRICRDHNLLILEDGAQGFGGSIDNKMVGSFGDAATTSFFPAKPLGCYGDGGAIFTNNDETAELIRSYKVHGKGSDKYDNLRIGVNSRLDTIQAAILTVKLDHFKKYELEKVNSIAKLYNEGLKEIVQIPVIPQNYYSSYAQYTIRLKNKEQRNYIKKFLETKKIPTMIYYVKPMHEQQAFSYLEVKSFDYSVTNRLCETVLSLPMHPYLTEVEIDLIISTLKDAVHEYNVEEVSK